MADVIESGGEGEQYLRQDPAVVAALVEADVLDDEAEHDALVAAQTADRDAKVASMLAQSVPPEKLPL